MRPKSHRDEFVPQVLSVSCECERCHYERSKITHSRSVFMTYEEMFDYLDKDSRNESTK